MRIFFKITTALVLIIAFSSCTNKRNRQVQYMNDTDMYEPVPYEAFSDNPDFEKGMTSKKPVKGAIARGKIPYNYPDTEAGYLIAKDSLQSPLDSLSIDLVKGKRLYGIYCATCHGTIGDGQGDLVKNEKFLGVPNYKDREITEGSIYHVIMYGRNLMGSHASQLTDDERWQVTHYVQQLRNDLLK